MLAFSKGDIKDDSRFREIMVIQILPIVKVGIQPSNALAFRRHGARTLKERLEAYYCEISPSIRELLGLSRSDDSHA